MPRNPFEDFLTEALADLIGRMPREISVDLVSELFFAPGLPRLSWLAFAAKANALVWTTQRTIYVAHRFYRLDLMLEADQRPLLVIEVKVHAAIRDHTPASPTPDREVVRRGQLETYGCWIAESQSDNIWPGALAILTLGTEPPKDFRDPKVQGYGVAWRRVVRWPEVYRALKASIAGPARSRPDSELAWQTLTREFCVFLEEKNMAADMLTSADYALCEAFLPSHSRLSSTFEAFLTAIMPFLNEAKGRKQIERLSLSSSGGVIWGWAYLNETFAPAGDNCYVGWGMRFPVNDADYWEGATPELSISSSASPLM